MEAATVPTQLVEKREYVNNTAGWLGVSKINHEGKEEGYSIEPYGTVFLSDAEAILTSRAPRRAEDNPFEEQVFVMQDAQGTRSEMSFRPLTLVGEGESKVETSDRFLPHAISQPGVVVGAATPPAATEKAAEVLGLGGPPVKAPDALVVPAQAPPSTGSQDTSPPAPAAPDVPSAAPVPKPRQEAAPKPPAPPVGLTGEPAPGDSPFATPSTDDEIEAKTPMVVDPVAPGQVLRGNLGGDDQLSPEAQALAAADPVNEPPPSAPPSIAAQAAPPSPGSAPPAATVTGTTEEEHAGVVDPEVGEETGQAKPPVGDAPEGEFGQAEEVGSPDAPEHEGFVGA
jgi:hypothetical protein